MAQCSSPADLSEATKTKKVAIITGITGQVTIPTSGFLVTMLLILLYTPLVIPHHHHCRVYGVINGDLAYCTDDV